MASQLTAQHNKPTATMPARRQIPVPIAVLAGGTAGVNIFLSFLSQMRIAGRAGRLQFTEFVNYNQAEIDRIHDLLKAYQEGSRLLSLLPTHVHEGEGWGGDPSAWKETGGLILLDQEEMAAKARAHSQRIGSLPSIIPVVASLGGGHAEVVLKAFQALHTAYPEAFFLPIILIPDNPMQHGFIREYTYQRYDETLAGMWALVVDNAAVPQDDLNDRLSLGLTSLDTCGSSLLTPGSLRQAVFSLGNAIRHHYPADRNGDQPVRNGFFRLAVIRLPLRSRKAWCWGFPLRQLKLVRTRGNQIDSAVRLAIKECLETASGLLDTNPLPAAGIPQIVAVTLPVKPVELSAISRLVKAILSKEDWWQAHAPGTSLLFGSVNFTDPAALTVDMPERSVGWVTRFLRGCFFLTTALPRSLHRIVFGQSHRQKELYVTVTRLFPELGQLHRLEAILHPTARATDGISQQGYGFGMRQAIVPAPVQENNKEASAPVQ